MRELLLIGIVLSISCGALAAPIVGLYGYIWFALLRPDVLAWSDRPYSVALASATVLGLARFYYLIPRILGNPIVLALLALQVPLFLSAKFAVNPAWSEYPYSLYQRVILMALLVPVLVRTPDHIRWLVALMGGSLGFLGAKYGLFGLVHGGVRFTDGPGGFLADNNCFALAMVMAVPMLWHSRDLVEHRIAKLGLATCAFLTVAAVVMTYSRGAAISLVAVFLVMWLRARRKLAFLAMVVAFSAPAVYLVGPSYIERLKTLQNPEEEASANSRIVYGQMALQMAADYPWIGVGFGSYNQMRLQQRYMPEVDDARRQVVHNTYLQMLTDSGFFAFCLYVSLLFGVIAWLGFSARRIRAVDFRMAAVPVALQTSLIGYAVGSTFLSRVAFDLTYFLLMAAAAWLPIARGMLQSQAEEQQPEPAPEAEPEAVCP